MNELPLLMDDMPLETMHDGASAWFGNQITAYFNQHYKSQWIGHVGSVPWLLKVVH
jgi:hypothetical protein